MSKSKRSGGRILVDGLVANRVSHAFCVPGESYLGALDAFYHHRQKNPKKIPQKIQLVTCRQEGGAAYMAEAQGKLSGQPGICFVSRGPGAANAMVGVHTAFQDSTPMLLFIGQIPRIERGREAFQELDYARVYGGVAKAVFRVEAAADIPRILHAAWTAAISDRPGPVAVELPEDTLTECATVDDLAMPMRDAMPPPADAIARFGELLRKSKRPLIIFGGAGWTPRVNHALADFCEKHAAPAACAFRRQDMLDNHHPNYIGELGIAPNPELVELVGRADLVIALAARLGEMTSSGYSLFDIPEFDASGRCKLVHIFPSKHELNSVYRASLSIAADAELFLDAVKHLPARHDDGDRARIEAARQSYLAFVDQPRDEGETLRMDKVMTFLRRRLPPDAIITNGAGNYTVWAQRNYQFRRPQTQLAATNGSMGYGVPAAIAAKLLRPKSPVVAFAGDGCFLMSGQELATAMRYRLNVIVIVVNNRCYATIRSHQQRHYPDRPIATELTNPDFAALARAYGAHGACVRRTEEFEDAFESAVAAERPALIELRFGE